MAYIDGRRLDHLLASPDTDLPDKMAAVKAVFAEMKARHCMALFERNHKLIHFDANIRNIMMKNGRSIHIDFEMGRLKRIHRPVGGEGSSEVQSSGGQPYRRRAA